MCGGPHVSLPLVVFAVFPNIGNMNRWNRFDPSSFVLTMTRKNDWTVGDFGAHAGCASIHLRLARVDCDFLAVRPIARSRSEKTTEHHWNDPQYLSFDCFVVDCQDCRRCFDDRKMTLKTSMSVEDVDRSPSQYFPSKAMRTLKESSPQRRLSMVKTIYKVRR